MKTQRVPFEYMKKKKQNTNELNNNNAEHTIINISRAAPLKVIYWIVYYSVRLLRNKKQNLCEI